MIPIQIIRNEPQWVIERLKTKHFNAQTLVDELLKIDQDRKAIKLALDQNLTEQNALAKQIGQLFKNGQMEAGNALKGQTADLKEKARLLEHQLQMAENTQQDILYKLPNIPSSEVPEGKTPDDNVEVFRFGSPPDLSESALPHWDLAAKYDLIDFELGVKITGAGFPVYKGKGAKLQRALINYFLDKATEQGYLEIEPPILINEDSGYGTGQLPDKEGQMYHVGIDNLYLAPTAEVPITNLYRDVIVREDQFPIKNTAYTPCFRREAGSYGKDVRGLNRLHQFDKVEIVQIQHPDRSYDTLEEMKNYVASLVASLGLHFRIIKLCGGDMSFASALTYDFEVWSSAQKRWLEVSSVSNFEGFQANRMRLRYKSAADGKNYLAHTLNGSAMALPRIVAALLEHYQSEDGIAIPDVLVPYTGFSSIV